MHRISLCKATKSALSPAAPSAAPKSPSNKNDAPHLIINLSSIIKYRRHKPRATASGSEAFRDRKPSLLGLDAYVEFGLITIFYHYTLPQS